MSRARVCQTFPSCQENPRHPPKTDAKGRCVAFGGAFATVSRTETLGQRPGTSPRRSCSLSDCPGNVPDASRERLEASQEHPGASGKRPWSIRGAVSDRLRTSQKASGLILQRFGFDLGVSDKIRQPPPRLLHHFFCRHCAPAARLEPPFLFKALAAVLHVASNFTSCLMCRCFSIDSPFFKSALNHEPVISEVGVAVVGWRLQGHLTYPGT